MSAARGARLIHVATTDMSLALLLGPQLVAFREAGYEVFAAAAPGDYAGQVRDTGATFVPLEHATRAMAPASDARLTAELYRLFRRLRPDIVHTHNPKPGVFGRLAARAARVPVIVHTTHGLYAQPDDARAKRALVYGLERVAGMASHAELVQNPEDVATMERIGVRRDKLAVLGNGVDLQRFDPDRTPVLRRDALRAELGAGPETVVVGAVGRLVWEKGYRELFAAAAELRSTAPNVRVVVIGPDDPDKDDRVDAAAIAAAERDGVTFLGLRLDVEDWYAAMDVYVLASHREGFPRSAMEAAAMALPVVATDIRGCRQVVDDGVTGLLVPVRDPAALAAAIARLANDRDLREQMGRAGREKARREFDDRRVIDITLATYERLLTNRSRTSRGR